MGAAPSPSGAEGGLPELRPRSLLDLLDATVRLYRRHFGVLLGVSSVVLLPFSVAYAVGNFYLALAFEPVLTGATSPFDFTPDAGLFRLGMGAIVVSLIVAWIGGPLSQGALALAISEQYLGRRVTVGEVYRRAVPYWWALFLVSLVFSLVITVAPLGLGVLGALIGVPIALYGNPDTGLLVGAVGAGLGVLAGTPLALVLTMRFFLYDTAMVLEDIRGMESMQRSRQLVAGYGWTAFAAMLLAGIGTMLVTAVATGPITIAASAIAGWRHDLFPQMQLLSGCAQQAAAVLLGPVMMIVQTLLYYDLRIRKEGFDLQKMAEALQRG